VPQEQDEDIVKYIVLKGMNFLEYSKNIIKFYIQMAFCLTLRHCPGEYVQDVSEFVLQAITSGIYTGKLRDYVPDMKIFKLYSPEKDCHTVTMYNCAIMFISCGSEWGRSMCELLMKMSRDMRLHPSC